MKGVLLDDKRKVSYNAESYDYFFKEPADFYKFESTVPENRKTPTNGHFGLFKLKFVAVFRLFVCFSLSRKT